MLKIRKIAKADNQNYINIREGKVDSKILPILLIDLIEDRIFKTVKAMYSSIMYYIARKAMAVIDGRKVNEY